MALWSILQETLPKKPLLDTILTLFSIKFLSLYEQTRKLSSFFSKFDDTLYGYINKTRYNIIGL